MKRGTATARVHYTMRLRASWVRRTLRELREYRGAVISLQKRGARLTRLMSRIPIEWTRSRAA